MANVIPKYFFFQSPQGRSHGCDLRHNIDAVTIIFHHSGKTSDLPFYPTEPFRA